MKRLPPAIQRAAELFRDLLAGRLSPEAFVTAFEDVLMEDDNGETSSGAYYKIFNSAAEWVALFNPDPALRSQSRHLIDEAELRRHMETFLDELRKLGVQGTPSV